MTRRPITYRVLRTTVAGAEHDRALIRLASTAVRVASREPTTDSPTSSVLAGASCTGSDR
jgi:hypothetical protein